MKYYAHFGFTDFVLCLGYKAEAIKQFFLTYNEAMANDFVLSNGGADVHLLRTDIHDWNITFVDTGLRAPIGERLRAVRHLLADDELFLANYGDTLTDADLPAMIARAEGRAGDGELPRGAPELQLPRGLDGRRWPGPVDARRDGFRYLDQRGLFHPSPGVPRPAATRRGPRRGAVAEADVDRPVARAAARGILGPDGHAEGPAVAGDPARGRQRAMAGLGSRSRRRPRARVRGLWLMLPLLLGPPEASPARALAIGAHPDDIEIGCAGTILKLIEEGALSEIRWVVLSGEGERARGGEAKRRRPARRAA